MLQGSEVDPATERPVPRLCVNQSTTPHWTLAQDVMGWQEVGVAAIGLVRRKLEAPSGPRGVAALLESDVAVSSLAWIEGFTGADGRSHDECIEDGLEAVRLASLVGARVLVVDTGARGRHIASHALRMVEEGLLAVAEAAARSAIRVAVRPCPAPLGAQRTFLSTVAQAVDLVDGCDHEAIGIALDTRQLWFEHDLPNRVREFAPLVHLVQLAESRPGCRRGGSVGLLEDGRPPLRRLLDGMLDAGYSGDVEVALDPDRPRPQNYVELLMDVRQKLAELFAFPLAVES